MSLSQLKRLAVRHPRLLTVALLTGLLLLVGVDPVAAGPPGHGGYEPNGVFIGP